MGSAFRSLSTQFNTRNDEKGDSKNNEDEERKQTESKSSGSEIGLKKYLFSSQENAARDRYAGDKENRVFYKGQFIKEQLAKVLAKGENEAETSKRTFEYFKHHFCTLKHEQVSKYELESGLCEKFIAFMTCACIWDKRSTFLYRSYASVFEAIQRQFTVHPFSIHPFSRLRLFIEIFVVLNYHVCIITMSFYWPETEFSPMKMYTILSCQYLYVIFIVSNFFTGYVVGTTSRRVILDIKKITWRYVTSWFLIDMLYCFGLHVYELRLFGEYSLPVDIFVFATKLFRLPTLFHFLDNFLARLHASEKLKTFVHAAVLIANYIFWNVIFQFTSELVHEKTPYPTNPRSCSWLTIANLWNATSSKRMAYSFYRAVNMLRRSSVTDMYEVGACVQTFNVIFWIIGFLVCFHCGAKYMILKIGEESARAKYFQMIQEVKCFMDQRRFPDRIKQKILKLYAESKMMECVSGQLREDIILHTSRQLVSELECLKGEPRHLVVKIGSRLRIMVFLAGDIVMKINTIADCLYFISRGTVAVYTESGAEVTHLQDGDYFGELELVLNLKFRIATIVAVTNCELFMLSKKDFDSTVGCYPTVLDDIKKTALKRQEENKIIDEHSKDVLSGLKANDK